MTTLGILSDLHLAPRGMSRCSGNEAELLQLLDTMEARCDRIVIAGDLFDLSRPLFPGAWRAWLDEIRLAYPRFVGRIQGHDSVFGNHDIWLQHLGVPEVLQINLDGWRVRVQHGHQFDVPLKQIRPLEAAANYVAGWLVRTGLDGAAEAMGHVPVAMERSRVGQPVDRSVQGAERILQNADTDVVVMGHSHLLRRVELPCGVFVNTGSLCCGHLDWVRLDGKTRTAELFRDGEPYS